MIITSFKREFDTIDEAYDIDESTITKGVDIDTDKVVNNVMTAIRADKESHKKRSKLPVILVAASVSTAIIGTSVVASTNIISSNFNNKYKGDTSAITIYENDSFKFTTKDDNLKAEFIGLVGDEDFTMATVELTKKDGSTFFNDGFLLPLNYENVYGDDCYKYQVIRTGSDSDSTDDYNNTDDKAEYILSRDGKTLTLYLTAGTVDDPKNTKLDFHSSKYYSYNFGKALTQTPSIDSETYKRAFEELEYASDIENKNAKWIYENGKYVFHNIETEEHSLDFDISLTLDKKLNASFKRTLDHKASPHIIKEDRTAELKISPFKLRIENKQSFTHEQLNKQHGFEISEIYKNGAEYQSNAYNQMVASSFEGENGFEYDDIYNCALLMKDGTQYNFSPSSIFTDFKVNDSFEGQIHEWIELNYTDIPIDAGFSISEMNDSRSNIVNPSQIAKIMIKGDIVYMADGYEDKQIKAPEENSDILRQWESWEIRNYLASDTIKVEGFSSAIGMTNQNNDFRTNVFNVTIGFTNLDVGEVTGMIEEIMKQERKGLYISRMIIDTTGNDKNYLNLIFTNPYLTVSPSSNYEDAKAAAMATVKHYEWADIFDRYMSSDILPDKDIPFSTDNRINRVFSEYVDTEGKTVEFTDEWETETLPKMNTKKLPEPEREPITTTNLKNFTYKVWSEDDVKNLIMNNKDYSIDRYAFCSEFKVMRLDYNFYYQRVLLEKTGTKNEVYNLINKLTKLEESNLFVSTVRMSCVEENNGNYDVSIELVCPYKTEEIKDQDAVNKEIIEKFGRMSRQKLMSAFYDKTNDLEILGFDFDFLSEQDISDVSAICGMKFVLTEYNTFDDFLKIKKKFTDNDDMFVLSEEMAVAKIQQINEDNTVSEYMRIDLIFKAKNHFLK